MWSDNNTDNPRTDTNITENITVEAMFELEPTPEPEQTPSEEPSRRSSSRRSVPSSLQAKNNTLNSIVLQYKDSLTTLHTLGIISLPQNILDILNIQPTNTTNTHTRDLELGMTGQDVISLQKLLNSNGYTITSSGAGSLGNETEFFGALTQAALARYQAANGISPSSGYFGPLTRTFMKNVGLEGVWW